MWIFEMNFVCFAFLRLIFPALIFVLPVISQTVSGTVTDAQNAPIAAAEVSLSANNRTIAQTQTDDKGSFLITIGGERNLALRVSAKNFASYKMILNENNLNAAVLIVLQPQNLREEVTVSITRVESRLSETPASVVVLDKETLEATAAQTVDDSLRQIAGFSLFRRSSSKTTNPTTQGANLRGVSGSGAARTSVLFDGVSINDAFGGWTFWSRAPQAAIEQIEVLRGGASSVYGSAALSGAVNILTKRAKNDSHVLNFELSAGTQNTFDGSLFAAKGFRNWNFSLAAEGFLTNGYIPVSPDERGAADSNANSRRQNYLPAIEYNFGGKDKPQRRGNAEIFESGRIFLRGNYFTESRDNGTILQTNRTRFRQAVFGGDLNDAKFGAFEFRFFLEKQIYDQSFSAVSPDRNAETLSRLQRVPSQSFGANLFWSRAFANHAVSASIETRRVRGFSSETVFANNRAATFLNAGGRERTLSIFAQDFWRVNQKLNVNFGARFDAWKNFDALSSTENLTTNATNATNFPDRDEQSFSPRIAAIYQVNDNFSLYGSFAKSFRAPTLNELYRAFRVGNVLTLANENLRAERADTFEAGLNFSGFARRLNLRGNFFVTEVSNPVVSVTLNAAPNLITRQRQNLGETRSRGLELDAEFAARKDLRFSASYLFVDARIAEFPANLDLIGKVLPQIPKRQFAFQTFYRPQNKFLLSLQARFSDAQFEDDLNALRLRPFFTLDAFASYRLTKTFEIFTAIENIFDNRYDIGLTPNRTRAAPRFARVGLRFDLGNK